MILRAAGLALALFAAAPAVASDYGCSGLAEDSLVPTLEGRNGEFFRLRDLRMAPRMSPNAIALLAGLARALEAKGTALVYLALPPKPFAMAEHLPPDAARYGFDVATAHAAYAAMIDDLRAAGIAAPNLAAALATGEGAPFLPVDFHWTAEGARRAADATAAVIRATPAYAETTPAGYTTRPAGTETAFSNMRRTLQLRCTDTLPRNIATLWETTRDETTGGGGLLDLFGTAPSGPEGIAIVGTSFADSPTANFAGFLSQATGLDAVNHAVTGGQQFGAILQYLLSDSYAERPPRYLVWENPSYNPLDRYADAPFVELEAVVSGRCTRPLAMTDGTAALTLAEEAGALLAEDDSGRSRSAVFTLTLADGGQRVVRRTRTDRARPTGRFVIPIDRYGVPVTAVHVAFDTPGPAPRLIHCPPPSDAPS